MAKGLATGNGRRPGVLGTCGRGSEVETDGAGCAEGRGCEMDEVIVSSEGRMSKSASCEGILELLELLEPPVEKSGFGRGGNSNVSERLIVAAGEGGGRVKVADMVGGAGDASTKLVVNWGRFTLEGITSVSYAGMTLERLGDRPPIPEDRRELRALLEPPTLIFRGDNGFVGARTRGRIG